MKVKIGNYKNWIGPYQIADLLQKVGVSEDTCFNIGAKLSDTWIYDVCQWVYDKRKRKVKIKLDKYDTWNMDYTLALLIVPMLKQLKETTNGYPADFSSDYGCVGQLTFDADGFKLPEDSGAEAWNDTLDKMIWAFGQVISDDWEDQYYTGVEDYQWKDSKFSDEDGTTYKEITNGPKHTLVCDSEGIKKHYERMQEGFDLFGKYYRNLWD